MNPQQKRDLINDIKKRGWVLVGNCYELPGSEKAINALKNKTKRIKSNRTGDVNDSRNSRCLERKDVFTKLIEIDLNLIVYPEFHFSPDREYRFDYAIPDKMVAIEVQGGIWCKGNSGHSSGTGIKRDMEKSRLATSLGWKLIQCTPDELLTNKIIELIKKML